METVSALINEHAKKFLGEKAWSVELLLQMGVELAKTVNSAEGLSGKQKTDLVCQTILDLLADAEKAEKEHQTESTATATTTAHWAELKIVVKTLLPVTLHLVISAARGKFSDLQKKQISQVVSSLVPSEVAAPAVEIAENVLCGFCLPLLWKSSSQKSSTAPESRETREPPKVQEPQAKSPEPLLQIRRPEPVSQESQSVSSQSQA